MRKRLICAATLSVALTAMISVSGSCFAQESAQMTELSETETEAVYEAFNDEVIMFVLDTLKVHKGPDKDDSTIAYIDRGDSVSVLGRVGDWYHVRLDSPYNEGEAQETEENIEQVPEDETEAAAKEGYIHASLLTEDKEEMEKALASNEAQKKINEAAAAAAAAAASERYVVSTQKIPDCDGAGGTIITRYSDGTTSQSSY